MMMSACATVAQVRFRVLKSRIGLAAGVEVFLSKPIDPAAPLDACTGERKAPAEAGAAVA